MVVRGPIVESCEALVQSPETTERQGFARGAWWRVIVGVGVDVVDVERWKWMVRRSTALLDRTLTKAEQVDNSGRPRTAESLAARFAAKEAVAKTLGAPGGLTWHDCEIVSDERGQPSISLTGSVAQAATERGISHWHLSLTHDGDVAIAYVIAESRELTQSPGLALENPL